MPHATAAAQTINWREPPLRFLDVGHSRLAYRRIGSGPDIVFVHGWPVSGSTFRGIVDRLRSSFTCHVVDLPGAGHTQCDDMRQIELGAHVETLWAAIEQMGIDRFAMVAHDSGGLIARYIAARAGDRVSALVMGNTEIAGHQPWQFKAYFLASLVPGLPGASMRALRWRWLRRSSAGFGVCFSDPDLLDGEFAELCMRPILEDPVRRAHAVALLENITRAPFEGLAQTHREMTAPTQLIWGAQDTFFPLAKARRMAREFTPEAEWVVLDPGKLFVHEERPEAFAQAALPFLQRHCG